MLKNILKLVGAQKLTNNEQKSINGGDTTSYLQGCIPMTKSKCEGTNGGVYYGDCCVIEPVY